MMRLFTITSKSIFLGICVLLTGFCKAGNADSLIRALKSSDEDTNKVHLYFKAGQAIEGDFLDSAQSYYEQAGELSKKLGFTAGLFKYYANITYIYNVKSDFATSLKLNRKALELARQKGTEWQIASTLQNAGSSFLYLAQYDSAAAYCLAANSRFEKLKDSTAITTNYTNLSALMNNLKQFEDAIVFGEKAITLCKMGFAPYEYAHALANCGNAYGRVKQYQKALNYYRLADEENIKKNDPYSRCVNLSNMVDVFEDLQDYKQMLPCSKTTLELAQKINSEDLIAAAYHNLGLSYFLNKQNDSALAYEKKAIELAKKNDFVEQLQRSYNVLYDIYIASGDYESANQLAYAIDSIREAVVNEKVIKSVEVFQANQQTELEKNRNLLQQQELNQRKIWLIILVSLVGFLVIFSLLVYYLQKQRQQRILTENKLQQEKIQLLEREKQLEATQALLQGEEQERSRLARDLHDGLGGILSSVKYSFNNMRESIILNPKQAESFALSINKLDESIAELRRIAQNMMPENLQRFGLDTSLKDLCSSISADGKLKCVYQSFGTDNYVGNSTLDLAVYRIAQEILHNAVKHAEATQAILQLSFSDKKILLTAEDNGKGFDTDILKNEKGSGFKSIQNRVNFLNGNMHIESNTKGTTITVEIPT